MVNASRKAIEYLYRGTCTVVEYQSVKNQDNKRTEQKEVQVLEKQPCKLSFTTIASVNEKDNASTISQVTKLFIAPEIVIKPGSKIIVTQDEVTNDYAQSGVPAVYTNHQEIILQLFEGWA